MSLARGWCNCLHGLARLGFSVIQVRGLSPLASRTTAGGEGGPCNEREQSKLQGKSPHKSPVRNLEQLGLLQHVDVRWSHEHRQGKQADACAAAGGPPENPAAPSNSV